uniref:Uncharacterized protein n=1 Tax=viral metagenome TaxID=1070528 RepID=A0A6H2A404_9ZZZZ
MTNREADDPQDLPIQEEDEQDRPRKRHPGDFDDYPTDEQKEYFKRGGR